ncbi:MAG: erythromycin esterase family protein [Ignavibacteria bacterium]
MFCGKGDAYTTGSQGFWTWDTKEVLDMIEWMRSYNKSVPETRRK